MTNNKKNYKVNIILGGGGFCCATGLLLDWQGGHSPDHFEEDSGVLEALPGQVCKGCGPWELNGLDSRICK